MTSQAAAAFVEGFKVIYTSCPPAAKGQVGQVADRPKKKKKNLEGGEREGWLLGQ